MRALRSRPVQLGVVAAALVLAGVVVLAVASPAGVTFGWFAHEPFPSEVFGSLVVLSRGQAAGAGLVVLGLLLAAAAGGFGAGARARGR